jgi:hypothetical protein
MALSVQNHHRRKAVNHFGRLRAVVQATAKSLR